MPRILSPQDQTTQQRKPSLHNAEDKSMGMFCNQCEQASKGTGCDIQGVCGKNPEVAALQDLMLYGLKGIAIYADKARAYGVKDDVIDYFVLEGLFTTVTNV